MRCGRVGGPEELTKSRPMGSTSHSGEHHLGDVEVEGDGDEDRHNTRPRMIVREGSRTIVIMLIVTSRMMLIVLIVMLMLRETVREGWVSEVEEGQFPYLYFWPC